MTLVNSQPPCGWELHWLEISTSVTDFNAATSLESTAMNLQQKFRTALTGPNGYKSKQMGLFYIHFSDHRSLLNPGPGARLIPWFLPECSSHPGQRRSNNLSLRVSSLSNSSTIYLSFQIGGITGVLGYTNPILYSSLSTLLLFTAPFPNPPTSNNHLINHVLSTFLRKPRQGGDYGNCYLAKKMVCTLSLKAHQFLKSVKTVKLTSSSASRRCSGRQSKRGKVYVVNKLVAALVYKTNVLAPARTKQTVQTNKYPK